MSRKPGRRGQFKMLALDRVAAGRRLKTVKRYRHPLARKWAREARRREAA